jgi:hypothetical protein
MKMTQIHMDIGNDLGQELEKWEDSLKSNYDDFVVVDNEEGDFGVIRYLGTDVDGNENAHLITKYVHGGDQEESFYTLAGADVVQKLMREHFEATLRRNLERSLDPGSHGKLRVGFIQAFKEAEEKRESQGLKIEAELHDRWAELFPKSLVDGGLYKYGFKYFEAKKVSLEQGAEGFMFVNFIDPNEFLAISPKLIMNNDKSSFAFQADHETWMQSFVAGLIRIEPSQNVGHSGSRA